MNGVFQFHHIGLACKNIKKEMLAHELLNYKVDSAVFEDCNQQVRGIFMTNGAFRVELLEPLTENSPLNNYIKKGIKMYHQCFKVSNIVESIEMLRNEGAIVVVEPIEAVAFENKKIAFLYLKTKMVVELVEM